MKLQLKNIKVAAFASEETHCYQASLYVNGKRAATVSNQGHGGCDEQRFMDPSIEKAVNDFFASQPAVTCHDFDPPFEYQPTLETWCGEQVEAHLRDKKTRSLAAKASRAIWFVEPGSEDGLCGTFRLPPTPENVARAQARLKTQGRPAFFVTPEFIRQYPEDWHERARLLAAPEREAQPASC